MIERTRWFERKFPPIEDLGLLVPIIERLNGTHARMTEKVRDLGKELIVWPYEEKWSVKKEIGHLIDLEPLWSNRIRDFQAGSINLAAADLTNRKTDETDHDATPRSELLDEFRMLRSRLTDTIVGLDDPVFETSLLHPRLGTPMRVVDLAFFIAEHDDHHLSRITSIAAAYGKSKAKFQ